MAKKGFKRNSKTIANILHNDPGVHAAVDEAAGRIFAQTNDPEKVLSEPYHTDRYVRGIRVPADNQRSMEPLLEAGQAEAT